MKLNPLARSLAMLPFLIPLGCASSSSPPANLPPAHLAPMHNNLNPLKRAYAASGTLGKIERLDPGLDALLSKDAQVEILVDNVEWAEGPIWVNDGLLFSDVKQNTIYRWTEKEGVTPYLQPSGYNGTAIRGGEPGSNGLTLDLQGRLVMCQHGNRRVARLETDGQITPLADRYQGKRFSSPNDLCFDSKGNLYFTDPPYGLERADADPKKELQINGVYFLEPDGQPKLLPTPTIKYPDGHNAPLRFPNGIALSPDEQLLYVAVSDPKNPVIVRYDVQPEGGLANGEVFFDAGDLASKKLPGLPDGMKIDVRGNLWIGGPGGILVISPEGTHLGTIATGVPTANCAWGGDGSTLYICANHTVCRIKTRTKGIMPPRAKHGT